MKRALVVLLGLVLLAACSSAPSAITPTPASQSTTSTQPTSASIGNQALVASVKAGDWSGTGENNFSIAFSIGEGGNKIDKGFRFTYKATCGTNATNVTETLAASETIALTAGEIKFKNENYEISGKAVAADRIEGTLKAQGVRIGRLGECGTTPVTWTAAPK